MCVCFCVRVYNKRDIECGCILVWRERVRWTWRTRWRERERDGSREAVNRINGKLPKAF